MPTEVDPITAAFGSSPLIMRAALVASRRVAAGFGRSAALRSSSQVLRAQPQPRLGGPRALAFRSCSTSTTEGSTHPVFFLENTETGELVEEATFVLDDGAVTVYGADEGEVFKWSAIASVRLQESDDEEDNACFSSSCLNKREFLV